MKKLVLLNGNKIPVEAYGTWLIENQKASSCVQMALEAGYTHIDTAQAYGNEEGVGQGIKAANKKRSEVYITSKVKAEIKNYEDAKKSIDESLKKLDTDYIDLMLIHCPQPWALYGTAYRYEKENLAVWRALEEAYEEGKVKAIGVSNFNISDLENIIQNAKIMPMANQICIHIGRTDLELINYCQNKGIVVEAYSPIAHGRILDNEQLREIADKYNVSIPQLCIKYTLQLNTITISKASSKEHIEQNRMLDFTISDSDMELLKQMRF